MAEVFEKEPFFVALKVVAAVLADKWRDRIRIRKNRSRRYISY